jgi:hypothetical protein
MAGVRPAPTIAVPGFLDVLGDLDFKILNQKVKYSNHFAGFDLTSIELAVMLYSTVTLEPTLKSPLTLVDASRASSQRSFPF